MTEMDSVPDERLADLARSLLEVARRAGVRIATAESCTGGLVAAALTEIPGSSDVVERGFVTYSNAAKAQLLGVPVEMLQSYGAVSEPVCRAMADGALKNAAAELAVSVTGIAGPTADGTEKPVGLVFVGTAMRDRPTRVERFLFKGDRRAVRRQSVERALSMMLDRLAQP